MPTGELSSLAVALLIAGVLLAVCTIASRLSIRSGVPVLLIFLGVGMLAGAQGLGGIDYDDYGLTFRLGTVALLLILFDGGLNTSLHAIQRSWKPAAVLATLGVLLTAGLVAGLGYLLGLPATVAILLGAIVSSTDAAAVFAVLRGSNLSLRKRTGTTLELESGLNDPMAVSLTIAATAAVVDGRSLGFGIVFDIVLQLSVGLLAGWLIGSASAWLLKRVRFITAGLYPVLTLGLACMAFALPTLVWGSGFLAVYVAAVMIGNAGVPHSRNLRRVHDAVAWFAQVAMFLLMGLLVMPTRLLEAASVGLFLALGMTFLARPLAVWLCLLPFRFAWRDTLYIGLVGLRGAVPILLAMVPLLAGAPDAERIFDLAFFIVVAGAILPGALVPWLTRRLRLESGARAAPPAVLEIDSLQRFDKEVVSFTIRSQTPTADLRLCNIPFPDEANVLVVVRGDELLSPRGATELRIGDHVHVLCRKEDLPLLYLLFGAPEGE